MQDRKRVDMDDRGGTGRSQNGECNQNVLCEKLFSIKKKKIQDVENI